MVSLFLQELWICTSEFNKPKVLALYLIIESLNQIHEIEAINLFLLVFKTVFVKMRRNGMYLSTLRFQLYVLVLYSSQYGQIALFIFITALLFLLYVRLRKKWIVVLIFVTVLFFLLYVLY